MGQKKQAKKTSGLGKRYVIQYGRGRSPKCPKKKSDCYVIHFPCSATHARKCNFRRGVFKFLMSEDRTIKKSPFCENPNGFIFKLKCFVAAESKWLRGDFDSIQKSHHFELTSKWVEVSLWWASKTVTNGRLDTREVRTAVGVIWPTWFPLRVCVLYTGLLPLWGLTFNVGKQIT